MIPIPLLYEVQFKQRSLEENGMAWTTYRSHRFIVTHIYKSPFSAAGQGSSLLYVSPTTYNGRLRNIELACFITIHMTNLFIQNIKLRVGTMQIKLQQHTVSHCQH